MIELTNKDIERFWSKVDIKEPDDCWFWKANIGKDGYGQIWIQGKMLHAIRVSLHIAEGLPLVTIHRNKDYALHKTTCPNKSCVNPNHLYIGTAGDNRRDTWITGHEVFRKSRFTVEDVNEMKRLRSCENLTQCEIGKIFGITQQMVSLLLRDKLSSI
jgi:hypothetical protein